MRGQEVVWVWCKVERVRRQESVEVRMEVQVGDACGGITHGNGGDMCEVTWGGEEAKRWRGKEGGRQGVQRWREGGETES